MLYERSLAIETRLQTVLSLIENGDYSTPELAAALGVSVPTVSRDVTALRQRGHAIRAERRDAAWRYVLENSPAKKAHSGGSKPR
jgi:DeoR/GlpR family transcriptional regulator of sugar metabolism